MGDAEEREVRVGTAGRGARAVRWGLWVASALFAALLFLAQLLLVGLGNGPAALAIGLVLGVLLVPFYLFLVLWLDRYEREPVRMLAAAFIWGAAFAIFFSILFGLVGTLVASSLLGDEIGTVLGTSVLAPLVEEISKGLALFVLYLWKKDEFDGVVDGIVYGAVVGLGFTMSENILYYGSAAAEEGGGITGSLVVFFVFRESGFFAHSFFTGVTGLGLGLARQSGKGWAKVVVPVAGLVGAIALHSIWNSSTMLGLVGFLGAYFLIMIPASVGLLVVVAYALRREGCTVRRHLTPELKAGLLSQQEYDALGSVRGRLGSSFRALRIGGVQAWRARSRINQAASELAFHRNRVSRGITSANDAEREAAYIRSLREGLGAQLTGRKTSTG